MNQAEVLRLFDTSQRREVVYPDIEILNTPELVRHTDHTQKSGFINYSAYDETSIDAAIQVQLDYFGGLGYGFEWKVFDHDTPTDLKERLLARGFSYDEGEALMVLDINDAPAILRQSPTHDIRRLTDVEDVRHIQAIEATIWGETFDDLAERLRREMTATPDKLAVYLAYVDDKPVAAAWMDLYGSHFAGLWGGSTLPEYRQMGIYTALVAARLQTAQEHGIPYLFVDAGTMSRPILEKQGFQFMGHSYPLEWSPPSEESQGIC